MGVRKKIKVRDVGVEVSIYQAFEEFVAEKEALGIKPKTLSNYKQSVNYFMEFNDLGDDSIMEEVNNSMFYKWINTLKLKGNSVASINHYLRDVKSFFNWCYDKEYLAEKVDIDNVKGQEEQPKAFTENDILELLEKPKRGESFAVWRTWAIVNWVLGTGNRAATICEVKISDVDFVNKTIALRHTKNNKAQNIPLSSSLATTLKEYMRNAEITGEWLFPNIADEQLTTNALRHSFSKYCKDRGVDQTNIHGLRHSFAITWITNGGSQYALQNILGHSTVAMTSKYVRLSVEDTKKDFDTFNALDSLKKKQKRTSVHKKN